MASFHITDDPWIDVLRSDGDVKTVSLRELLTDLHQVERLSESSPLTEVALLRFLIALVSDGLRELVPTEEDWLPFFEGSRNGLSVKAVEAILEPLMASGDVLAADHAGFFDGPTVRRVRGSDDPNAAQPVSRFLPELPTGTNLAHFAHLSDESSALCVACLLKSRLVDAAFARGGLGPSLSRNLLATISGTEPRYVVLKTVSLLDTLLINLLIGDASRPSWVSIHRSRDGDPGPIARMSWRPRLMLPTTEAASSQSCVACATTTRPRFSQAVMLDTYNHTGSQFGSKGDLDRWKISHPDPHLLPVSKNELSLGLRSAEWPLRALARLLGSDRSSAASVLLERCATPGLSVSIQVTSSAGNQAKIDDAPAVNHPIPSQLLTRSEADRAAIATALTTIFDRENRGLRERLIPEATPRLLQNLAISDDTMTVVSKWLGSESRQSEVAHTNDGEVNAAVSTAHPLDDAARRIIKRLTQLPSSELQALKPPSRGGAVNRAVRQAAFEQVWHRLSLPGTSKRHAVREALTTVAGIFAVHGDRCRLQHERGSFAMSLNTHMKRHGSRSGVRDDVDSIERLVTALRTASNFARDELLLRLVDEVIANSSNGRTRLIDFADLLIDVVLWNDPHDPTPARWERLLNVSADTAFAK